MKDFAAALASQLRAAARDRERFTIAIDGPGCCGKSTLAEALSPLLGAGVLGSDDFHRPHGAPVDASSPLGYRRWREFLDAATLLAKGEHATFRPIDWGTRALKAPVTIAPARILIVEGIGSLHPSLTPIVDYRIWVDGEAETRMARVAGRDGVLEVPRWSEYVAREQRYLETCKPWRGADVWVFGAGLTTRDAASSFSRRIETFGKAYL